MANLVVLAAIATVGLAALAMAVSYRLSERNGLERLAELAVERLELYAASLESELGRLSHLPALVGLDADVLRALNRGDAEDLALAQRRLAQLNARVGSLMIYLTDETGALVVSSAPLPLTEAEQLRFEHIARALQAGSNGFFVATEARDGTDYFHAMPLRTKLGQRGQVIVRINLAPLEATWVDLGVRSRSERLLVLDARDVVIMTSVPAWKYKRWVPAVALAGDTPRQVQLESLRYPQQALRSLRYAETTGPVRGGLLLRVEPDGESEQVLLAQERRVTALGLRLITLSDPADVLLDARLASWGGAAAGALVGMLMLYWLYRRRMVGRLLAARNALQQARDALEQQVQARTQELLNTNDALKRENEQRVLAQGELVQAGKLAVLGQMSAGIAHEVNQPLTALRALSGNTQRLMAVGRFDDVSRNLVAMEQAVERMARITTQLKGFARRGGLDAGPVRLRQAIANTCALLEHRLREAQVSVDVQVDEHVRVRCDGNRLEQVMVNLVSNAIDAMRGSGTRHLRISADPRPERTWVRVADTGGGMAPEAIKHLFEPFFTTKPTGEGLGLGLVISAQIVREFGGQLEGWTEPAGMVFQFDLETMKEASDV
jgi:two-component system, NtrC family, C4-dicarboxylate transport sensor histidine kinase DctB